MNISTAKTACQLSKDAYETPDGYTVFKIRTAKAVMTEIDGYLWVSVEGTRPKILDWLKNLWTVQTGFYGLQVHSGCAMEAKLLFDLILGHIGHRTDGIVMRFTGHSQGGGVAPLLAWAFHKHNFNVDCGYAFAPMRSIEKKSCKVFNKVFEGRWWGITRQSDIVPHLPPNIRYGNTGHGKHVNGKGELIDGWKSPVKYMMELARLVWHGETSETWSDHDIDKYLKDVNSL